MPEVSPQFIDPKTGKIKPLSEYAGHIQHDANSVNLQKARPEWFKEDGTIKTTAEIRDEEAKSEFARRMVDAKFRALKQARKGELSEDERLILSLDTLIEDKQLDQRYASPEEKRRLQMYIDMLESRKAELVEKIAAEKRVVSLSENPQVKNLREHAEAFARTPPPGVDAHSVAMLVAIAKSTDFEPGELTRFYWSEVAKAESQSEAFTKRAADEAQERAYRAEHEAAQAKVAELETQQRLAQAREAAGE
jgi:hypothetical protein